MTARHSRSDRVGIILDRVGAGHPLRTTELAHELGVSTATLRRDLQLLEELRLLARVHGGVPSGLPARAGVDEMPVRFRAARNRVQKRAVARAAAELLAKGPITVGLTGGTTTGEVARLLARRVDVTVVTNALDIAVLLGRRPRVRVIVTGGVIRPLSGELVGPLVTRTLAPFQLDAAVIGVDGLDAAVGLSTHDHLEAHANAAMIDAAAQVVVVADGSKIGRVLAAGIAPVTSVHRVVTDRTADPAAVAKLRAAGVRVLLVS